MYARVLHFVYILVCLILDKDFPSEEIVEKTSAVKLYLRCFLVFNVIDQEDFSAS